MHHQLRNYSKRKIIAYQKHEPVRGADLSLFVIGPQCTAGQQDGGCSELGKIPCEIEILEPIRYFVNVTMRSRRIRPTLFPNYRHLCSQPRGIYIKQRGTNK